MGGSRVYYELNGTNEEDIFKIMWEQEHQKGDIRTNNFFQQTMFMGIIDTPNIIKYIYINEYSLVYVKHNDMKWCPNIFVILKQYIKGKRIKEKYNIYMIKNKLYGISRIEKNNKINGWKK